MDKQEFETAFKASNNTLGDIVICRRYIASLEADVEQLKADNLNLMKQVGINGKALDLACDTIGGLFCPYKQDIRKTPEESLVNGCVQCWKEYYLKKAGE